MDRIVESLLGTFSKQFGIEGLPEDDRFEHFSAYLATWQHFSETAFNPTELVTGNGGDTGIDAIAIVINNNFVTDPDTVDEILEFNGYLDVTFIFVQAERSEHFEAAKIGTFGFGVWDFLGPQKLPRNEAIKNFDEILKRIYKNSPKFRPSRPSCFLYYVTTGVWNGEAHLIARIDGEVERLKGTNLLGEVRFIPVGANEIQKLFAQTINSISRTFEFLNKTTVPAVAGVRQSYLGFLPANTFLNLVSDEHQQIIKSLFYENPRDFEGYNKINEEIRNSLSVTKDRFVLMNNGVTIIAKVLHITGNEFSMSDFYVVNGCQTSHVLRDNSKLIDGSVNIPVRLISTRDEDVIESIIKATNRQTPVSDDRFFAMKDFAKKLETYFFAAPIERRLYYERRSHQYDSQEIVKARIVVHSNLVRAVGAMFLGEPHVTTKNFKSLLARVGTEIFSDTDRLEPYYAAALTLYKLEEAYRAKRIDPKYKAARHQILLAARLIMDVSPLPPMNSYKMAKRSEEMIAILSDDTKCEKLLTDAVQIVEKVAVANAPSGIWDRDSIRTEPVTVSLFKEFGVKYHG